MPPRRSEMAGRPDPLEALWGPDVPRIWTDSPLRPGLNECRSHASDSGRSLSVTALEDGCALVFDGGCRVHDALAAYGLVWTDLTSARHDDAAHADDAARPQRPREYVWPWDLEPLHIPLEELVRAGTLASAYAYVAQD
jgi:hypothetical protein